LSISLMARVTYICEGVILGSVSSFDKVFIRVLYYFRLQLYPLTQVLLFYLTVGRRPNCRLHLYGCLSCTHQFCCADWMGFHGLYWGSMDLRYLHLRSMYFRSGRCFYPRKGIRYLLCLIWRNIAQR
jgi:hypothetical protein